MKLAQLKMRCAVVDWKKEYFGLSKKGIDSHFYELFRKKIEIFGLKLPEIVAMGSPEIFWRGRGFEN